MHEGYGLILSESEENYCMLFRDFLAFHGGNSPNTVITDGALALTNSCDKVFSCNRLRCNWHLWRNLVQKLGKLLKKGEKLETLLFKWFRTYDKQNFESFYGEIKPLLPEKEANYLEKLHQIRNKWSRAYNSTVFNANTLTTTRNESWHSKIKIHLYSFNEISDLVSLLLEIDCNSIYRQEKPSKVYLVSIYVVYFTF
jgi:hypothetical protein